MSIEVLPTRNELLSHRESRSKGYLEIRWFGARTRVAGVCQSRNLKRSEDRANSAVVSAFLPVPLNVRTNLAGDTLVVQGLFIEVPSHSLQSSTLSSNPSARNPSPISTSDAVLDVPHRPTRLHNLHARRRNAQVDLHRVRRHRIVFIHS